MKIIKLDGNNYTADRLYDALDSLFYFLSEHLPKLFLVTVYLDEQKLQLPRYITQKHYDSIDADTKKLMDELNQQLA
jgi:hypothetical protein